MLVAGVLMERNLSFGSIPEQGGSRPRDSVSIKAMNLYALAKGLPRNGVRVFSNSKKIFQFHARIGRSRIRFHSARKLISGLTKWPDFSPKSPLSQHETAWKWSRRSSPLLQNKPSRRGRRRFRQPHALVEFDQNGLMTGTNFESIDSAANSWHTRRLHHG